MLSDHTPRRVVSLQPSATVILAAVGKLDRVVACTKYCVDVCPQIARFGVAIVHDSWTANTAQIIAANPDLVIAAVPYQETAVSEILKSGARFLGLAPKALQDIYTDIAAISGIVDAAGSGRNVITKMQQDISDVRKRVQHASRPRVFCEEWGKPLIASQPWVAELVEAAGGEFIGPPGQQISADTVASSSPDVIIAAWCGAGDQVPLGRIVRDRDWSKLPAAREGRVFCISDELLNTPAPTLIGGLHALAGAIHPELFPQTDGLTCLAKSLS